MRHRSLPPSLPPQDHHLGGKAAEPVGPRVITSQKKANNLSRRLSGGQGRRLWAEGALDRCVRGAVRMGANRPGKGTDGRQGIGRCGVKFYCWQKKRAGESWGTMLELWEAFAGAGSV